MKNKNVMKKGTRNMIIGCTIGILLFIVEHALGLGIYTGLKNWFLSLFN